MKHFGWTLVGSRKESRGTDYLERDFPHQVNGKVGLELNAMRGNLLK